MTKKSKQQKIKTANKLSLKIAPRTSMRSLQNSTLGGKYKRDRDRAIS